MNRASTEGDPPTTHLAVYGTLRPGEENHWVLRSIRGEWHEGTVRGYRFTIGWGAAEGYPGLALSDDGGEVPVAVLVSDQLPKHWHQIDEFEGSGYRRVASTVTLTDGTVVEASIYEALTDNDD